MKKINLIFDMNSIYDAFGITANRSGIYFCTINLLNEFNKYKNIEITLYIPEKKIPAVTSFLRKELPGKSFKIISDYRLTPINICYINLRHLREYIKLTEKNCIKKFCLKTILKFIILPLSPIHKLTKHFLLNRNERFDKNTVFFSTAYPYPEIFSQCKKFTIIHDVIPLVLPQKTYGASPDSWFSKLLRSLNDKDFYIANSEYTRNDFIKHCPQIAPEKTFTVLHACRDIFKPQNSKTIITIKEKYNIPTDKKYIFSLCTLEPRKNLIRTVKTFIQFIKKNNIDDLVFVLGGGHWEIFIAQLEQEIENLGEFKNKIIRTGYIADEDLPHLYSGAEWFVYTSQYEGFGVPPLEAMSCGCPVIVSNNSSLPEVVGNAGLLIDWDSDEQHIEAYEKYYFNENIRKEYAQKGLERAKEFSWQKSAEQMIEYINKTFSEETILNDEQKTNIC